MRKRYLPSIITAIILVMIVAGFTILELQKNNTTIIVHEYPSTLSEDIVSDTVDNSSLTVLPEVSEKVSEEASVALPSNISSTSENSKIKTESSENEKSSDTTLETSKEVSDSSKYESLVQSDISFISDEQSVQQSSLPKEVSHFQTISEEESTVVSVTVPEQSVEEKEESSKEAIVISPALSAENITLKVGESKKIYLENTFDGARWYCDNSAVAGFNSADMSGATVEGRMPGITYVTATVNGTDIELKCIITVLE